MQFLRQRRTPSATVKGNGKGAEGAGGHGQRSYHVQPLAHQLPPPPAEAPRLGPLGLMATGSYYTTQRMMIQEVSQTESMNQSAHVVVERVSHRGSESATAGGPRIENAESGSESAAAGGSGGGKRSRV